MDQYKVLVEGRNYLIRIEGEIRRMGFFTTRWIDSWDSESAKNQALELIRNELGDLALNSESNPPMILVERVSIVNTSERSSTAGAGFTWYPEDEKSG